MLNVLNVSLEMNLYGQYVPETFNMFKMLNISRVSGPVHKI